jgi:hypothetical protein
MTGPERAVDVTQHRILVGDSYSTNVIIGDLEDRVAHVPRLAANKSAH